MKKFLAFLAITAFITACGGETEKDATTSDTTATTTPAADTSSVTAATPAVKDSLMQFKDGKVMIMTGGSWAALSAAVTTTNGRKVSPDGEVSKGGKTRKMEEGMMIDKDGQLMDKDGKMMDNTGWE
jgi:hypothetical protein